MWLQQVRISLCSSSATRAIVNMGCWLAPVVVTWPTPCREVESWVEEESVISQSKRDWMSEWGDAKMAHRRIGRDREDRRGMGLRRPHKTTCASHGDQEKLQQLHESALGKKKVWKKIQTVSLSLSFSPTLSIFHFPLHLLFSPHVLFSVLHALIHAFLLRWISSCDLPPSLRFSSSPSPADLPFFLHATPFWERTGSQPRLLLARVVSRQIKYGWTRRAPDAVLLCQVGRKRRS